MNKKTFLEIIAAAGDGDKKTPKVKGVAYAGGKMRLGGWGDPVVVDLSGITIPESLPLLADHWNAIDGRVGVISATVTDGTLEIEGEIVATGDTAEQIVTQGKAGASWQLSIGAEVSKSEYVDQGTRLINGQEHEAPFVHVISSTLREVSVVAVGADRNTVMQVTATANLTGVNPNMDANKVDTATIQAEAAKMERDRVLAIRAACAGECGEIEKQAIEAGWTVEETTKKVLEHIRAARPVATPNIIVKEEKKPSTKTLEASLAMRAGIDEKEMLKSYGEEVVEAAAAHCDITLTAAISEALKIEGHSVGTSLTNADIRAAFSTVSLPGILSNVANKRLLQAYRAHPIIATQLCTEGDLADFKEVDRYRLTDVGDLQPLAADGEIKHGSVTEEKATNKIDTYAKMFSLTRQMIINDDLGAFLQVPTAMGNRAARKIDELFFKRLLANPTQGDGLALFVAKHKNLLSGATSALSADALKKAIQLFLDQVDADKQPINVEPKFLLVPTALKFLAMELVGATSVVATGSSDKIIPNINVLANAGLQVIASPYLSNENYAGASADAWYLFGQPGVVDTFEIGYLRGKRTPTVEVADTDFNTLGKQFRVYFDVGVREQDFRGMMKSAGK